MAITNEAFQLNENQTSSSTSTVGCEIEELPETGKWYEKFMLNRLMISAKIIYFLEYAKGSCHWEYPMLFFIDIGLTPEQAGMINGVRYLGSFIGAPLLGLLADKKQCHKILVMFICITSILANCLQPLVPYLFEYRHAQNSSNLQEIILATSGGLKVSSFGLGSLFTTSTKSSIFQAKSNSTNNSTIETNSNMRLFAVMVPVVVIGSSLDGSTMTFADYGVLKRIRTLSPHSNIGMQRAVGPAGYALGTTFASIVITYVHLVNVSPYAGIFLVYTCTTALLVGAYHFLYTSLPEESLQMNGEDSKEISHTKNKSRMKNHNQNSVNTSESVRKTLVLAFLHWNTWFFLMTVIIVGEQLAFAYSFTFLYLKEMGAQPLLFGYSSLVNGSTAIIFFALSKLIVKIAGGALNGMALSCFVWFVRFLALSFMRNPYYVLLTSLTNGVCCSLFAYSYMEFITESYPASIQTTMCGITNALYYSLSFVLASVINGPLYMHVGARKLFRVRSIVCLVWSCIIFWYGFIWKKKMKQHKENHSSVDV